MKYLRGVFSLLFFVALSFSVFAFAGGTGTSQDPYQISNCVELNDTRLYLTANYTLFQDIDCSDTKNWENGEGWIPVGDVANNFKGVLDGNNHNISGLYINRPTTDYVGLFGYMDINYDTPHNSRDLFLFNISFIDFNITGHNYVGAVVGYAEIGPFSASRFKNINLISNHVNGTESISCLLGYGLQNSINITDIHGNCTLSGNTRVGGLFGGGHDVVIQKSSFSGTINGGNQIGGLAAFSGAVYPKIYQSYSDATINCTGTMCGGLVGTYVNHIADSYFKGKIYTSASYSGGIIGYSSSGGASIRRVYSTGLIQSTSNLVGGIDGASSGTSIYDSFSIMNLTGTSNVGSILGQIQGGVPSGCYWYDIPGDSATDCNGGSNTGCTQKTDINFFKNASSYIAAGWDFNNVWGISDIVNGGYPYLQWENVTPKYQSFTGTNFNSVQNLNNVSNAQIIKSGSSVRWNNNVNVAAADFDSNMAAGQGFISLDATKFDRSINSSANISLLVSGCELYSIYYSPIHQTSLAAIKSSGQACNEGTTPACTNIVCTGNTLTFKVEHFDGYGAEGALATPEFSDITIMIALGVILAGFFVMRKRMQ